MKLLCEYFMSQSSLTTFDSFFFLMKAYQNDMWGINSHLFASLWLWTIFGKKLQSKAKLQEKLFMQRKT